MALTAPYMVFGCVYNVVSRLSNGQLWLPWRYLYLSVCLSLSSWLCLCLSVCLSLSGFDRSSGMVPSCKWS